MMPGNPNFETDLIALAFTTGLVVAVIVLYGLVRYLVKIFPEVVKEVRGR